jgi:hypothetical protein
VLPGGGGGGGDGMGDDGGWAGGEVDILLECFEDVNSHRIFSTILRDITRLRQFLESVARFEELLLRRDHGLDWKKSAFEPK